MIRWGVPIVLSSILCRCSFENNINLLANPYASSMTGTWQSECTYDDFSFGVADGIDTPNYFAVSYTIYETSYEINVSYSEDQDCDTLELTYSESGTITSVEEYDWYDSIEFEMTLAPSSIFLRPITQEMLDSLNTQDICTAITLNEDSELMESSCSNVWPDLLDGRTPDSEDLWYKETICFTDDSNNLPITVIGFQFDFGANYRPTCSSNYLIVSKED